MKILAAGIRRSFAVTFGTVPGYAQFGVPRPADEVQAAVHRWMRGRLEKKTFILTGVLSAGQVLYAWPGGAGVEPVWTFAGEVSVVYCPNVGDSDVVAALNELAGLLAEEFKQTRVYVSYRDEAWVLERDGGQPSPSGEAGQ